MTLKDLYFANSEWHGGTMLTVRIRTVGQVWTTMKDTISNLPKNVVMSEVICFNRDSVICFNRDFVIVNDSN